MNSSIKNPLWIAITFLAVLACVIAVIACIPAQALPAPDTGAFAGCSSGNQFLHDDTQQGSCTREAMDQCEYACMMPDGVLDLYCYEDCIYSIC